LIIFAVKKPIKALAVYLVARVVTAKLLLSLQHSF
jgi:hypothetical protein